MERRRGKSSLRFSSMVSFLLLGADGAVPQVPLPHVLELRAPAAGISRIDYSDMNPQYYVPFHPFQPLFAGDVNGDGYDDFLAAVFSTLPGHADTLLIYGAPRTRFGSRINVRDLRTTLFLASQDFIGPDRNSLAGLGDLDGDGYGDFAIGSPETSWEGMRSSGQVMVVHGTRDYPEEVNLGDPQASGVRVTRIISRKEDLSLGRVIRRAGDLNGDGKADFALRANANGTEDGEPGAGRLYVIYGGFDGSRDIELPEIGQSIPGLIIHGGHGKYRGIFSPDGVGCCQSGSVAPLGDVNGDGYQDIGVSGRQATNQIALPSQGSGALYLILGGPNLPGEVFIARPGGPLVKIVGVRHSGQLGSAVASPGDLDGDGLSEILLGEAYGTGAQGAAYLIYGKRDWPPEIRIDDPALRTFRIEGSGGNFGQWVANIGDWNQDGLPDLFISASFQAAHYETNTGKGYIVFGRPNLEGTARDLEVGTEKLPGLVLVGRDSLMRFGYTADSGGDLDGDGIGDLLVSSVFNRERSGTYPSDQTSVYVLYGGEGGKGHRAAGPFVPPEGGLEGGYEVTLFGRGFRGNEEVWFGGVAASQVHFESSAEVKLLVPRGIAPGRVEVNIVANGEVLPVEGGFIYTDVDLSPDISLEPEALKKDGRRVLYFNDTPVPLRGAYFRQFLCAFFSDLDGDGLDDLFLGDVTGASELSSRISIIFGRRDRPFPESIGPGETADWGTVIEADPSTPQNLGAYLAFPGDLDGDGHNDLLLGPYLLFGRDPWPGYLFLPDELRDGRAITIHQDLCFNSAVAAPGDLDGNGHPDLLLTYNGCSEGQGKVRLFLDGLERENFPPVSVEIRADPTAIQLPQYQSWDRPFPRSFGSGLSAGGDLNGDRWPDFIVGADHFAPASFLFLGGPIDWLSADILELQNAGRAVKVHHEEMQLPSFDQLVGGLGDFNGDGIDDAAWGARGGGRDFHGASYVVFGSKELGKSVKEIGVLTADPEKVLTILGEDSYDWSGSVQPLGDVNGDGLADLGITGEFHRHRLFRAYVVFGQARPESPLLLDRLGNKGFRIVGGDSRIFSSWIGGLAGGDLDGDGFQDLALGLAYPDGAGEWRKQAVVIFGRPSGGGRFIRGDANGDLQVDLSDAVSILAYLFTGGEDPRCEDPADVDDDGALLITDAINLLNHLYLGGPPPPPPYPGEGIDPTGDRLRPCTR